jgi:Ca2+-binding RTX toxin-like protein
MATYIGTIGNDSVSAGYNSLYGADGDDALSTDQAGFIFIDGGLGNDYLGLSYSAVSYGSLYGGDGDDHAEGGTGNDVIFGGNGNDFLTGGSYWRPVVGSEPPVPSNESGDDYFEGGPGRDAIFGFDGNDTIYGGDGDDGQIIITTPASSPYPGGTLTIRAGLYGGAGDDFIDGGRGSDTIFGDAGNDRLFGGNDASADTLVGGAGNDWLEGGDGSDFLEGDGQADTLLGGSGNDTMYGDGAAGGVAGNDWLEGGSGNDYLYGQDGNDALYGQDGNDRLAGGPGYDNLFGGAGGDNFVIDSPYDGYDYIGDFKAGEWDALIFTSTNFGGLTGATIASHFYAGAGFGGFAVSGPYFAFDTTTGNLWYNTPGMPTLVAQMPGATLSSGSMYFV